jgi:antitoxin VapB
MVIHIKDAGTDALVRELAKRRGIGITAAIKEAVEEALRVDEPKTSLWDRTADLRAKLDTYPRTGEVADKRFYDSLWGQEDDE